MQRAIYLIRHAQSQPTDTLENAQWPLSELGCTQALALVRLLGPLGIARLFSSHYPRALATVVPFSQKTGLEIQVREGLHERGFVNSKDDDFPTIWRKSWDDYDYALPGCESNREAQARIVEAIGKVAAASSDDVIAICSHGAVLGLFLHSLDPSVGRRHVEKLTNPDVIKVYLQQDAWTWDRTYVLPGLAEVATGYMR